MKYLVIIFFTAIGFNLNSIAQTWMPIAGTNGNIYSYLEIQGGTLVGTNSGIFITKENGASFKEYSIGMPSGKVLYLSKLNTTIFCVVQDKGIYSSIDNGIHWKLNNSGRFYPNIQKSDNALFVQSYFKDTLFYTSDEGKTWHNLPLTDNIGSLIYASASKLFRYQFASNPKGLYESSDTGKTWSINSNGFNGYSPIITELEGKTYALNQHVYQLNSNGKGWKKVTTDTLTWKNKFGEILFSPEYFTILNGTIYAQNAGTIALKLAKWKSSDNSWSSFDNGLNYTANWPSVLTCLFSSGNKVLLCQNDTLLQTSESNNWQVQNTTGLNCNPVFAFVTQNKTISCYSHVPLIRNNFNTSTSLLETSQSELKWKISDKSWMSFTNATNDALLYFMGDTILSAHDLQLRYYRQSDKSSKLLVNLPISNIAKVFEFKDSLYFYGGYNENSYIFSQVMCFSKDFKFSEKRSLGAGSNLGPYSQMYSLIEHKNTMFELSSNTVGTISEISKYQNIDNNSWWKQVTNRINGENFAANAIGDWKERLYLGLKNGGGVLYSTDEGKTWVSDNAGLTFCTPTCFFNLGDTLLMGAEEGFYAQISGSSEWIDLTGNLPVGSIKKIDITSGLIVAQIEGGSLWVINREGYKLGYNSEQKEQFCIYPNPLNSNTFNVNISSASSYVLCDVFGKIIQSGKLNVGENEVALSENITKGIYFIQIDTNGNYSKSQKIIFNQ